MPEAEKSVKLSCVPAQCGRNPFENNKTEIPVTSSREGSMAMKPMARATQQLLPLFELLASPFPACVVQGKSFLVADLDLV